MSLFENMNFVCFFSITAGFSGRERDGPESGSESSRPSMSRLFASYLLSAECRLRMFCKQIRRIFSQMRLPQFRCWPPFNLY